MSDNKYDISKYKAVYSFTAFSGLGIVDIIHDIDDYAVVDYITPNGCKRTRNKIYINADGRSFIKKYGQRYYIDEFIRTDI